MYTAYCDGGSRGNPGPSAYAAVIDDENGNRTVRTGYLGITTNNVAEYQGLLAVLLWVVSQKSRAVCVYSDSMLLVQQIKGNWKIKNPALKKLWDACQLLIAHLDTFEITHVRRAQNRDADAWVNSVLDDPGLALWQISL
jgi:probable phosphoglycerate mutase